MSFTTFPIPTATFASKFFASVKEYGALGNGSTDDSAAIDSALSALSAAGGGVLFFPPGNYVMNTDTLIPPSNSIMQGAGIGATTITNTSTSGGTDCVLTVLMTMTGNRTNWVANNTTYPINAPTLGANTVTTTTAANAGNFSAGNIIMISGDAHATAFWYPSWFTTVVSAVAGTGVITLAETLPLGGSQLTTVQKILTLPNNITVRDMTLTVNSNIGGVSGAILEVLGCDTFLIENVTFINANPTLPGAGIAIGAPARRSGFRNCHAYQGAGPIELFGCSESFIEGCTATKSSLLIDGGSMDCTAINNYIKDPQENASAFHGIHCPDYDLRLRIIGNSITGLSGTFAGINCTGVPDDQRDHVIVGNTITGTTGNTTGINAENGVIVGNMFVNLLNGVNMDASSNLIAEGNYFDTVTNLITPFSGADPLWRSSQNPGLKTLPASTASPNVTGGIVYEIFQSGAFNVTGFTGGLPGDEITVVTQDANTSFVNSGGLQMKGGVNYNSVPNNTVVAFTCLTSTVWIEKSRSQ